MDPVSHKSVTDTSTLPQGLSDFYKATAALSIVESHPEQESYILVDTIAAVKPCVDSLIDLETDPPSLFLDLEGIYLSRHGQISILQIHLREEDITYLVDVHVLGRSAFETSGTKGKTLKDVLEDPAIPKAFFDVRNDSDALFSHYGVDLHGIVDIQLMELATRSFSKRCVNGLGKCIENDIPMTTAERAKATAIKTKGLKLFAPEKGGSYEVFNARPLTEEIAEYCAQDVSLLPRLWAVYDRKMTRTWKKKVDDATKDRVMLSQSASYNGKGRHMALGPWR